MFKKFFLATICLIMMLSLSSCFLPPTINVTIIDSEYIDFVFDVDRDFYIENHYKLWLEEQTGFNIEINEITDTYSREYLAQVIADGSFESDIIIINSGEALPPLLTEEEAFSLTDKFLSLDDYIVSGTNYYDLLNDYASYGIKEELIYNDSIYFFPTIDLSRLGQNGQSLWINQQWLNRLDLEIPTTTEDFANVLLRFKTGDPNQNGISDEIAFSGSSVSDNMKSHYTLINSFIYFDQGSHGFFQEDGELVFAPTDERFREALIYLNDMFRLGYIDKSLFELSDGGVIAIASDPDSFLGVFSAAEMSDIYTNEDEVFKDYIPLPPMEGIEQNAVAVGRDLKPAAAIFASSDKAQESFELLDLMLSEEAYLIATYGEEGIDWEYAEDGEISILGEDATIIVTESTELQLPLVNFSGAGTMVSYPHLTDGVSYLNEDIKEGDAAAVLANEPYFRDTALREAIIDATNRDEDLAYRFNALSDYIDESLEMFITGEKSPEDDEAWDEYLDGFFVFIDLFDYLENEVDI